MDRSLVAPDEFRDLMPGDQTLVGDERLLGGASVIGYRLHAGGEVVMPPLRDYLIVAHRHAPTLVHRSDGGRWQTMRPGPGDVTFFAPAEGAHWRWDDDLDVLHLHLSEAELLETSRQIYGRDVRELDLPSALLSPDPVLHRLTVELAEESTNDRIGNGLLIDTLLTQLGVLMLRRYTRAVVRDDRTGGLTPAQERSVREYVAEHLGDSISLADLAGSVYLSRYHFIRLFRQTTGVTPHEFVIRQRVERAVHLLSRSPLPIRDVARECGFADQSHLNRVFRQRLGVTPGQVRGG